MRTRTASAFVLQPGRARNVRGCGYRHPDHGAMRLGCANVEFALECADPFGHADQSPPARIRNDLAVDSRPVVCNRQFHIALAFAQGDLYMSRLAVPRNVGERFLYDAEYGGRALGIDIELFPVR